jgi:hypothetical protein
MVKGPGPPPEHGHGRTDGKGVDQQRRFLAAGYSKNHSATV